MKREGFSRASASVRGARRLEWTNGARRLQPSVCFRAGVRKARVDQRSAKASAERLLSCAEWKGSSGRTEREGFSRASASVRGARRLEWTNGARRLQPSVRARHDGTHDRRHQTALMWVPGIQAPEFPEPTVLPTRSAATQIHRSVYEAARRAFATPPSVVFAVPLVVCWYTSLSPGEAGYPSRLRD